MKTEKLFPRQQEIVDYQAKREQQQQLVLQNNDELLSVKQAAEWLGVTVQAVHLLKEKGLPFIEVENFDKGGRKVKPKIMIRSVDINVFQQQQQQKREQQLEITKREREQQLAITKQETAAAKIVNKFDETTIGSAFRQIMEGKDADTILQVGTLFFQTAINQLRAQKELAEFKNKELTIKLDQDAEWYSIKRVCIINKINSSAINWRLLKNKSQQLSKEIKSVPDQNYGIVKSYHIDVWMSCYPNLNY